MKRFILLLLMQSWAIMALAQVTLKGVITDKDKHPLPGASVVLENSYYGISADEAGNFEFSHLKPGNYTLSVTFIGYEPVRKEISVLKNTTVAIQMEPKPVFTEEVQVLATRASGKMPVAYSNLAGDKLQNRSSGQDLPYVLAASPSFVATSDAGTGIGYTYFRIRGTDMNRVNVTVDGIPLNDAESHATYFVDQPDLASSASDIQIQRGVGTSVNGGAAFGATINLQTLQLHPEPYGSLQTSAGSFNTFKNTVSAGTGLINKKFSLDVRLSKISSDGFIDRARSDLKSFFVAAGYYSGNTVLKAEIWSGFEETYQAWNGVPSVRLHNDIPGMMRYEEHGLYTPEETANMIASGSRTYNLYTYRNQVDHYQQDHYRLHFSHRFSTYLSFNAALHYTYGRGYYEEYKTGQKYGNYGIDNPVIDGTEIQKTDLIRRKWLDNGFYGTVFSFVFQKNKLDCSLGGGWNEYDGKHYGKLIWAQYYGNILPGYDWYHNTGIKTDFNAYAKINYSLTSKVNLFADLQYRDINYRISGDDDDLRVLDQKHSYSFFNPKTGIYYQPDASNSLYLSYARSNREPNRDNFTDTPPGGRLPEFETMNDVETGWNFQSASFSFSAGLYGMFYHNQLALTGQINDVGLPVMTNVKKSYRTGLELQWGVRLLPSLHWDGNTTLSRNRISDFTEYVDDWDSGDQRSFYLGTTDLAFSPQLVANSILTWKPGRFSANLFSSYVGKQFIDNTSSDDRILNAYFVNNLRMEYSLKSKMFSTFKVQLMVNNLLNAGYESNAWVYSYYYEGQRFKMDGYFPQAGRNYMIGLDISL